LNNNENINFITPISARPRKDRPGGDRNSDLDHSCRFVNIDEMKNSKFYIKSICLLVLFLIVHTHKHFAQEKNEDDGIIWTKDRKLSYSDFRLQKKVDHNKKFIITCRDSVTGRVFDTLVTSIVYTENFVIGIQKNIATDTNAVSWLDIHATYYKSVENKVTYNVYAVFFPYKSWINDKTISTLNHEEIHFDICELYSRILKKYIVTQLNKNNFNDLDSTVEQFRQNALKMHERFDLEAFFDDEGNDKHNSTVNAKWKKSVYYQLQTLKAYAKPKGTVILK